MPRPRLAMCVPPRVFQKYRQSTRPSRASIAQALSGAETYSVPSTMSGVALDACRVAAGKLAGAVTTDLDARTGTAATAARAHAGRKVGDPGERQVLHRLTIDVLERAVSAAAVVAVVRRPRLAERLLEVGGRDALALTGKERRDEQDGTAAQTPQISFQGHQVRRHVVHVLVRQRGKQRTMTSHRIVDFELRHVASSAERSLVPSASASVTLKSS